MKTCLVCGETFDVGRIYSNHVRWKHRDRAFSTEGKAAIQENARRLNKQRLGYEGSKFDGSTCEICNRKLSTSERKNRFCSTEACRFQAHSIGGTAAWKDRTTMLRIVQTTVWNNPMWVKNMGTGSTKPEMRKYFSSKGERELTEVIKNRLPQYHWQTGGSHNIGNNVRKAFDVYCKDIKLIVEYDGAYHWKNIYGNLPIVQMKDRQMETFCINNGWKLIRVNERTYQKMPQIVETIINMILNYEVLPSVTKLYLLPEIAAAKTLALAA